MVYSSYNIFSKIKESDNYFIISLLSGNADILSQEEAQLFNEIKTTGNFDSDFAKELIDKGYLIDSMVESKIYQNKYLDFIDNRETDEIQIFFVPNYSCNFACSYCYQDEYANVNAELNDNIIDAFFDYVAKNFADRKKYITVFGGEPLLNSLKQRNTIAYLIKKANQANLELSFVTNGYTLTEYVPFLKQGRVREVQVTLDGTENVHNMRRFLKGGAGTFSKIIAGVDACIESKITVNLRIVVDKENIENLPDLAKFAIEKGWTKSAHFKTQMGRNYELHHCQSAPDKLFDRITLYEKVYELCKQNPHILEFYKPAYSISKFLSENGYLADALFDSCPACKTEWAFDYMGKIYSCTATVGKSDELLGTFYPNVTINKEAVEDWQNRDVTTIDKCKTCNVQLACGGGCGSVAKNRNGKVCSPDCRPIKELLELGFSQYFQ